MGVSGEEEIRWYSGKVKGSFSSERVSSTPRCGFHGDFQPGSEASHDTHLVVHCPLDWMVVKTVLCKQ